MRTIGVIGCGVVGEAVAKAFETRKLKVKRFDKYRSGINDYREILSTEAVFLCLPTATRPDGTQNLEAIKDVLAILRAENYQGVICIKSTVLPGTCVKLSKDFKLQKIVHNPEFLTAANPYQDFMDQTVVLIGGLDMESTMTIGEIYHDARFSPIRLFASPTVTEAAKYMRNNFLATKVSYFNEQRELCEKVAIPYLQVLEAMLSVGGVERTHTKTPGPDGEVGFGGMCLPKDTLAQFTWGISQGLEMESLLGTIKGNNRRRPKEI